jgi:uncharacterized membrane protein HdeD (DUF308 family)
MTMSLDAAARVMREATAIWLLGVLLGIQLICEGAALGYLAWQVRSG